MYLKIIPGLIAILIIFSPTALSEQEQPWLDNFEYLELAPGESGKIKFTLTNCYPDTIENITLKAEIYKYGSLVGETKEIAKISYAPELKKNFITSQTLKPLSTLNIEFLVSTTPSTPQGVYFVRLWLEFDCNTTRNTMYSLGYFSDDNLELYRSGLLPDNCSGVIPETSFRIAKVSSFAPFSLLCLLIALIGTFAALATIFYFKER